MDMGLSVQQSFRLGRVKCQSPVRYPALMPVVSQNGEHCVFREERDFGVHTYELRKAARFLLWTLILLTLAILAQ